MVCRMPRWWEKPLGRPEKAKPAPTSAARAQPGKAQPPQPARWLAPDDAGNLFGVPLLDLMMLQGLISTSQDPACAARSVSWGASVGKELSPAPLLELLPIECELRYPAAKSLPGGILYAPPSMDFKWVTALRAGHLLAARSWTGVVEAVACR
jgi:hypothetical protein